MTSNDQSALPPRERLSVEDLFEAARTVRANAYAPYSGYAVGAAILSVEGGVFVGTNVENVAYPVGTCAEAGAVAAMIAAGHRRIAMAVVVGTGPDLATPCGACRQRLSEFADGETAVHAADPDGVRAAFKMSELLPARFVFRPSDQGVAVPRKLSNNITGGE